MSAEHVPSPRRGEVIEGRLGRALLETDTLDADVLVIGGGPAGAWAAVAAAEAGARVVLADKGWLGTSGATAAGGNNLWYLPEGPERDASIRQREQAAGRITDRRWMERVLEITWDKVHQLDSWGYPFPSDSTGTVLRSSLQGPQYMRLMRQRVLRSGVTVLDHCPASELLLDPDGVVSGARGIQRQRGDRPWTVHAGSVVLATGGCAFLSGALGCNTDTGDGALMGAEVGAELSGMEFSNQYALGPVFGAQTKGRFLQLAQWYAEDGQLLDVSPGFAGREQIQRRLVEGRVLARLDLAPAELRTTLRWSQPNFFLPYDKAGIDPFTDLFEVRPVFEGTVRGTGGLAITGDGCETTVPGLYAAGDAATRELITGGVSGGGSHNGAWAISSGTLSGAAAALFARRPRTLGQPVGRYGTQATEAAGSSVHPDEIVRAVRAEVEPTSINLFRTEQGLHRGLQRLDDLWRAAVPQVLVAERPQRAREAVAMVAHARWMYTAALARTESRAMHRRDDLPALDPGQQHRLRVAGLDTISIRPETLDAASTPRPIPEGVLVP